MAAPDVRLGHVSAQAGTVVQVPLTFANVSAARAVFTIKYDPVFLEPVQSADNPEQYHRAGKDSQGEIISSSLGDNTLQVVVENPGGLLAEGELVVLPFTLNKQTAAGVTVPLSVTAAYQDGAGNTLAVSPTETTTYHITATSEAGTNTLEVTVTADQNSPLTIQITTPQDGALIARPDTMVQGTITNSQSTETGVTVNGVVALKESTDFTANHVALKPGSNIITASVTDTAGHTIGTSIIVQADPAGNFIELATDTIAGIAPLEFTLSVDASFTLPATGATLTHTGPGTVEVLSSTQDSFNIRLTTPGIYYFTATVIDQGNTYTDVVAVQVLDKPVLEQSLKAKWNAMKARLSVHDPTGAASYYALGSRNVYKQQFIALSAVLPQIVQEMGEITIVEYQYPRVLYDLRTVRNGQTLSFQLTFILDRDGIWRIWNY